MKTILRKVLMIIALTAIGATAFLIRTGEIKTARAEGTTTAWILCRPGDYVNVRTSASTRSESLGRMDAGDSVQIDGRTKNGFAHAKDLSLEMEEGWIHAGYLVFDEPKADGEIHRIRANGRVACRKWINGPRRCWVQSGSEVKVWFTSAEWCVTNKGYIKSEYVEGIGR